MNKFNEIKMKGRKKMSKENSNNNNGMLFAALIEALQKLNMKIESRPKKASNTTNESIILNLIHISGESDTADSIESFINALFNNEDDNNVSYSSEVIDIIYVEIRNEIVKLLKSMKKPYATEAMVKMNQQYRNDISSIICKIDEVCRKAHVSESISNFRDTYLNPREREYFDTVYNDVVLNQSNKFLRISIYTIRNEFARRLEKIDEYLDSTWNEIIKLSFNTSMNTDTIIDYLIDDWLSIIDNNEINETEMYFDMPCCSYNIWFLRYILEHLNDRYVSDILRDVVKASVIILRKYSEHQMTKTSTRKMLEDIRACHDRYQQKAILSSVYGICGGEG